MDWDTNNPTGPVTYERRPGIPRPWSDRLLGLVCWAVVFGWLALLGYLIGSIPTP